MSKMYFYADVESIEVLRSGRSKALLLGSDFGYGNFGDVLQHLGAVARMRETSALDVVSIFALEAISRFAPAEALRRTYKVDALLFISLEPLQSDDARRLGLQQVLLANNISVFHLYGGGYLNELWGDFSLSIAEWFLERLPGVTYIASGQQVAQGYSERVARHVAAHRPLLFGVRDADSLNNLEHQGVAAQFSFDDAVEQLFSLSRLFELRRETGAFVHLNSSGYTGNEAALPEMQEHLALVADRIGPCGQPVLLQAFQDGREEVVDSVETVKRLERAFPFAAAETAFLVEAVLALPGDSSRKVLRGEFGYSCSYHVTMWLQLNGIPCWLRGSNEYYDQKRRSLGVEGGLVSFLEAMPRVDHSAKLQARNIWLRKVDAAIDSRVPVRNTLSWEPQRAATRKFQFKGEPRLEARLAHSWQMVNQLQAETAQLQGERAQLLECQSRSEAEIRERDDQKQGLVAELQQRSAALEASRIECATLVSRLQVASERYEELNLIHKEGLENHAAINDRLLACTEQLTVVGFDARYFRVQAEAEHDARIYHAARDRAANAMLMEIMGSRSWRWTVPLRAVNRLVKTGRLDAQGNVGLFEAVRRLGNKMPISAALRSWLGSWLRRMRRH